MCLYKNLQSVGTGRFLLSPAADDARDEQVQAPDHLVDWLGTFRS